MTSVDVNELVRITNHWGFVDCGVGNLYLGGNDDGIALRFQHGHDYEPESLDCWQRLCAKADLVVDIGAHTGFYTLAAYQAGAKQVISMEPYWLNMARLLLNIRANGYSTDGLIHAAATDHEAVVLFSTYLGSHPAYCSSGGRIGLKDGWVSCFVQGLRADSLVTVDRAASVGAIKIDVERNTIKVLDGMTGLLSFHPPLIVELTEAGVADWLTAHGYSTVPLDGRNAYATGSGS